MRFQATNFNTLQLAPPHLGVACGEDEERHEQEGQQQEEQTPAVAAQVEFVKANFETGLSLHTLMKG
jgi:hypothetical protein